MRRTALLSIAALALVASCDEPTHRPTGAADAIWKLAPEGTRGAIVLSPYAVKMIEAGTVTLRSFIDKAGPEMAAFDALLSAWFEPLGGKSLKLADLHLTATKGGALFLVKDGMVAVLPVADRAAFVAKAKGTAAATPDGVDQIGDNRCKMFGTHYVCATSDAILASVGKSPIKDRLAKVHARGDIELVGTELPLEGPEMPRSAIAAVVTIERGQWQVRGVLTNPPKELAEKLARAAKPRTHIGKSAGFAVLDLRSFIGRGDTPVVEQVTQSQLADSIAGPITLDVAGGSRVLDMEMPLSNPAPFQTLVSHCDAAEVMRQLGATVKDGVCHVDLAQMNLAFDLWVEGNVLHAGKKLAAGEAPPAVAPVQMTKAGIELATGQWGVAFWGRGTMFSPTGRQPTEATDVDPRISMPLRTMAMLDEIGFGVKQDGDLLRFVLTMRTAFADPDPVIAKLLEITAVDVLSNKADLKGKAIADAFPRSQFAIDFAAGQHGMVVPTQMLSSTAQMIIPALMAYRQGADDGQARPLEKMPTGTLTQLRVRGYATDGLAIWKQKNPGKACPTSMADLAAAVDPEATILDEWGKELVMVCGGKLPEGAEGIAIVSLGPDGQLGTADDIKSY